MKIDTIDMGHKTKGVCQFCHTDGILYPVRLDNDAWTSACAECGKADSAKVMA